MGAAEGGALAGRVEGLGPIEASVEGGAVSRPAAVGEAVGGLEHAARTPSKDALVMIRPPGWCLSRVYAGTVKANLDVPIVINLHNSRCMQAYSAGMPAGSFRRTERIRWRCSPLHHRPRQDKCC